MAVTALTTEKFIANNKVTLYDFDPGDTDPNDIAWVDFTDYDVMTIWFFRTVGTGAVDTFSILANPNADGSGTDVTVKASPVTNEPNATGDYILLEINTQDILDAAGGISMRGVTASVEFATGTDEGVIMYVLSDAKRPQAGLSVELIA